MTLLPDVGQQDAELVVVESTKNIGISFKNANGVLSDPEDLSLEITDVCGTLILEDTYSPSTDRDPNPPRILNSSIGRYEFPLGLDNAFVSTASKKNKTLTRQDLLFTWRAKSVASVAASRTIDPGTGIHSVLDWTAAIAGTPGNFISIEYIDPLTPNQTLSIVRDGAKVQVNLATDGGSVITTIANNIIAELAVVASEDSAEIVTVALSAGSLGTDLVASVAETLFTGGSDGTEEETVCINVRVITHKMCSLIGKLRLQIDKAVKLVTPSGDPEESCYLGYSNGQLITFLEGGLQVINAYQPSGCFGFENYPYSCFEFTLLESALMVGVMSQQVFAIDTDIPSWNDQGNAFVIQHQPQLVAYLNWLSTRLDKMIPQLKLNFVSSGSLHIEAGPNFRLAALVTAAPSGALFRNVFFRA